jgi:anti-sigma regulatory factor (Ser/Thr protein kinase)
MSRQTASRILTSLVHQGQLVKSGSTQTARYSPPSRKPKSKATSELNLKKKLKGLHEDEVFEGVDGKLHLQQELPENIYRIAYYAFCEMLNNAIDHSQSPAADIQVKLAKGYFEFAIRDHGVGIFHHLQKGFGLASEQAAVEHLLKGKQTTAPQVHSGQGLFFTSKIADFFQLRSHRLILTIDNVQDDIRLGENRPFIGTEVVFRIKNHSKKSLKHLFEQYSDEDFEFDRTKYPVIVLAQNGAISRSQGRRLTLGLDRFSKILLDFSKVKELGQGFADEIFRVFQNKYPNIVIEVQNANSAVHFMIRRAQKF